MTLRVRQGFKNSAAWVWEWLVPVLPVFVGTRVLLWVVAFVAHVALNIQDPRFSELLPSNLWLSVWARWDSGFYLQIAQQGYSYYPGEPSTVAFFPLYPLLIAAVSAIVGNGILAGVLLSNFCLLLALAVLYRLCLLEGFSPESTERSIFYIAAFPTAFFFSAVYTESLFLLLSLLVFYFARQGKWAWATVSLGLAGVTRVVGFVLALVLLLEWMRVKRVWPFGPTRGFRQDLKQALPGVGLALLGLLGLFSHMMFLYHTFGDPMAFWSVQTSFNRLNLGPIGSIWRDLEPVLRQNFRTGPVYWNVPLDLSAFLFGVAMSLAAWFRLGSSYALYCLITLFIPIYSGTGSLGRYVVVLFPVFMMLGSLVRKPSTDALVRMGFTVGLGLLVSLFANWVFVG